MILALSAIINDKDGNCIWRIVNLIQEKGDFVFVSIYLVDSTREWAVMKSGSGMAGKKIVVRGHKVQIQYENKLFRAVPHAIYFNKIYLHDYYLPSPYFNSPMLPDTKWELAFPLHANKQVLGALEVDGGERVSFQVEDTYEFQKVADEVSRLLVKFDLI